jgi:putative heme-binding domain-containing protein
VLSDADPVLIKCMGGSTQNVPRSRIAKMERMKKSLMYPPANLGLDAQRIADIVAWLKSR